MAVTAAVSGVKNLLVSFINGIGDIFDAVAGLAPEPWDKIFGFVVMAVGTFGVYHFKDPGAVVQGLTAFAYAVTALAVAGKELIADVKK